MTILRLVLCKLPTLMGLIVLDVLKIFHILILIQDSALPAKITMNKLDNALH